MKTINVLEIIDGDVVSIHSFPNNPEGINNAKKLFNNFIRYFEDEYEDILTEDICIKTVRTKGYYSSENVHFGNSYVLHIMESNEPNKKFLR